MRAGVFGRSRVWTCSLVAVHGGFGLGAGIVDGGVGGAGGVDGSGTSSGAGVCCVGGPTMSTLQRRGPLGSRAPCSILSPSLLCTSSLFLSMYAVQSASQSLPKLSRLVVNPGIMWPVRARSVGIPGIASTATPVEVHAPRWRYEWLLLVRWC